MRGNVVGFDLDTNTGAISGHDGNRYDFATADWHGYRQPRRGDVVDFEPRGQRAGQVYLIEPEYAAPSFVDFYFSYRGRISRQQFWLRWILPLMAFSIIFAFASVIWISSNMDTSSKEFPGKFEGVFPLFMVAFFVITVWTDCVVLVKRIHDRDKPGWLVFLCLGPRVVPLLSTGILSAIFSFVGLIVFIWFAIEFGCLRGTEGANQYGADPVQ